MRRGIGRRTKATRRLAKKRTPKKAVVAAVWPLGNELYLELKRGPFQPSSCLTDGRARPVATFSPRAAMPAIAQARIIVRAIRTQRLLPRHQARAARSNPADVRGPVAVAADVAHELFCRTAGVARHPLAHRRVEIKGGRNNANREQNDEDPFPDRRDFMHREFAGCFSALAIFESLSCNLQLAISGRSFAAACFFISPAPGCCRWWIGMSRVSPRPRAR